MSEPVITHVTITLDQPTLQTLRMGLSALQLATTAAQLSLDAQVNAALAAAQSAAKSPPRPSAPTRMHMDGYAYP